MLNEFLELSWRCLSPRCRFCLKSLFTNHLQAESRKQRLNLLRSLDTSLTATNRIWKSLAGVSTHSRAWGRLYQSRKAEITRKTNFKFIICLVLVERVWEFCAGFSLSSGFENLLLPGLNIVIKFGWSVTLRGTFPSSISRLMKKEWTKRMIAGSWLLGRKLHAPDINQLVAGALRVLIDSSMNALLPFISNRDAWHNADTLYAQSAVSVLCLASRAVNNPL